MPQEKFMMKGVIGGGFVKKHRFGVDSDLFEDVDEPDAKFFEDNEDDEDDVPSDPPANRKWIRVTIAAILAIVLMGNVLAFWPMVYNLEAIRFLVKSKELSQNEAVQQYKEAVVVVRTSNSKGTGFSVTEQGHIITNYHVIDGGGNLFVTFQNGQVYPAEVLQSNEVIDIALLRIQADEGIKFPKLELENNLNWKIGTPIYVIGNPLFFNYIANEGYVAGLTPLSMQELPMMMIQAPIYKGNSGSPVITSDGKVIAVVFATTKITHDGSTSKVGLAVPVHYFKDFLN